MAYNETHYVNNTNPPIDSSNLNHAEMGIKNVDKMANLHETLLISNDDVYPLNGYTDRCLNATGYTNTVAGYNTSEAVSVDGYDYISLNYSLDVDGISPGQTSECVIFYEGTTLSSQTYAMYNSCISGEKISVPTNAKYVRVSYLSSVAPAVTRYNKNKIATSVDVNGDNIRFKDRANNVLFSLNKNDIVVTPQMTDFCHLINFANPSDFQINKYLVSTTGKISPNTNTNYFTTGYIAVNPSDVVYSLSDMHFIAGYSSADDDTFVSASWSGSNTKTYTVPNGVNFIRITAYNVDRDKFMLSINTEPYYYLPYGYYIDSDLIDFKIPYSVSVYGGGCVVATSDELESETHIELNDFPLNLKKGLSMSFFAKFSSFTSLSIGKGYESYRGDWFEINDTNIMWKHYETSSTQTKSTAPHGLNISDFLMVAIDVDSTNSALCHITLTTKSGSASFDSEWTHEQNGTAFAFGEQTMTSVKFSAVANDIKCSMWLFGDSYFGVNANRVIGQLIDLGYGEGVLIDGLAGQTPDNALLEVQKLIAMGGVPKFLVWTLGMNGSSDVYEEATDALIKLSNQYGFELILYKVPTVPSRTTNNNAVNTYVEASGYRFVDAFKAVGANTSGTWYADYLSDDGVHPTELGARAIAMQILVDVPEIMQFGYSPMDIDGDAVGDL